MKLFKAPLWYKYRNSVPYAESAFWQNIDQCVASGDFCLRVC